MTNIPKYLYHGSSQADLTTILPKKTLSKDKYIGDFVFASHNKTLAIMYTTAKGFYSLMSTDTIPAYIVICADQNEYIKKDKEVSIYKLPSVGFEETPQVELKDYEFVSSNEAIPESCQTYPNALAAFSKNNIDVYFVDKDNFDQIVAARGEDRTKYLKSVAKYTQN